VSKFHNKQQLEELLNKDQICKETIKQVAETLAGLYQQDAKNQKEIGIRQQIAEVYDEREQAEGARGDAARERLKVAREYTKCASQAEECSKTMAGARTSMFTSFKEFLQTLGSNASAKVAKFLAAIDAKISNLVLTPQINQGEKKLGKIVMQQQGQEDTLAKYETAADETGALLHHQVNSLSVGSSEESFEAALNRKKALTYLETLVQETVAEMAQTEMQKDQTNTRVEGLYDIKTGKEEKVSAAESYLSDSNQYLDEVAGQTKGSVTDMFGSIGPAVSATFDKMAGGVKKSIVNVKTGMTMKKATQTIAKDDAMLEALEGEIDSM